MKLAHHHVAETHACHCANVSLLNMVSSSFHLGLAIPPSMHCQLRTGLTYVSRQTIVDENVNSPSEEFCSFVDFLADFINAPEVADARSQKALVGVLLQMIPHSVVELFLVNVENVDLVSSLQESSNQATSDAACTARDDCSLRVRHFDFVQDIVEEVAT